jgi:prepilin-type N-terminal cleavage/methylation domain-containing protein/prepilin-type processing-associated H-X9-DG protein
MIAARRAYTLVEVLVSIAIIGILSALLFPAVQSARASAARTGCTSKLRQLGVALHAYYEVQGEFPMGMKSPGHHLTSAEWGGFTELLPYIEQTNLAQRYDFNVPWYDAANYHAVSVELPLFYCPANRKHGSIDMAPIAAEWALDLPPTAAGLDYALCKGACAALNRDGRNLPSNVRGPFDVNSRVTAAEISDGTSYTIAMGDAAAGGGSYFVRDPNQPTKAATDPATGRTPYIEQSWSAVCASSPAYPYYGSIFAVTAQRGWGPDPLFERMNPPDRLVAATFDGDDDAENSHGRDSVSGFRSQHPGGCNFLLCDGAVRLVNAHVAPREFVDLSTIMGE